MGRPCRRQGAGRLSVVRVARHRRVTRSDVVLMGDVGLEDVHDISSTGHTKRILAGFPKGAGANAPAILWPSVDWAGRPTPRRADRPFGPSAGAYFPLPRNVA